MDKVVDPNTLRGTHLNPAQVEDMYQVMAIANYEDRFVIPSSHKGNGGKRLPKTKPAAALPLATAAPDGHPMKACLAAKATPIVFHDMRRDRARQAGE